jgi:hypothetical protein
VVILHQKLRARATKLRVFSHLRGFMPVKSMAIALVNRQHTNLRQGLLAIKSMKNMYITEPKPQPKVAMAKIDLTKASKVSRIAPYTSPSKLSICTKKSDGSKKLRSSIPKKKSPISEKPKEKGKVENLSTKEDIL